MDSSMTELNDNNKNNRIFDVPWLDSSYYETLFPSGPWQNICDILSLELAQAVRKQFNNPHRKQMIIELLGSQFKRSYLTEDNDLPFIIQPPHMSEDQRKKLENEAKSWLQIQINEIALKKSCAVRADQNEEHLCAEMKDYLEHCYHIISTSLDRHLFAKQNKINQELNIQLQDSQNIEEKNLLLQIANYSDKNDLRGVLKNRKIIKNEDSKIKEKGNKLKLNLTSEYTEFIAESLIPILKKDPRRIAFVLQKLNGQQLTNNLRKLIWSDILVRHERKKLDSALTIDIDLLVRKNFANGVTRGKNELKLNDPTQTPVSGLIENAVIETYSRVGALNELLFEQHLRQTMKILNILYTYSRDYEPYYIYWLLPFQLTFNSETNKNELIYDLAMYLDLFVKNLFPQWPEIFVLSSKILTDLNSNDPDFYEHLKRISKINSKVNPKDFVNEIIVNENKKAINSFVTKSNDEANNNASKPNKELLTEPNIFIRKWIGECFSGILRKNSLLYVWDQLFMSLWSSYDFEIITKALLYLLKTKFLLASDYDQMRKVFLDEPSKLYTCDIQSAYMHLSNGGKESEVPYLNKRDRDSLSKITGYYTRPSQQLKQLKRSILDPIGFKDIQLTLVVPKFGQTQDFDPSRVVIDCTLYYGSLKLSHKKTQSIPLVRDIKSTINETKTYLIDIMNENIVFNMSEFNQEPNDALQIFSFITIKYHTSTFNEFYLGYCKLPLYMPQKLGQISTWEITNGEVKRLLHPGIINQHFDQIPDVPTSSYKDRLGPGSNITLNVFDARSLVFQAKQ